MVEETLEDNLVSGNKARLAGDNADNDLLVGRNHDDIRIAINQAESTSTVLAPPLGTG